MSDFKIPEEVLAKLPPAFRNLPPLQVAVKIQQYIEFETKTNRVRDYKPSPKQAQFHELESKFRELMLGGGNRCLTLNTPIETAVGERLVVEVVGETGFDVRSWDGESRCVAPASPVFLKGIEPAFRVHLDNGRFFECSRRHRVLTTEGYFSLGQLIQRADDRRSFQTPEDSMASYGVGVHQHGQPLHSEAGSGLVQLLSPDDALQLLLWARERAGASEQRSSRSHAYRDSSPPTIPSGHDLILDLYGMFYPGANNGRSPSQSCEWLRPFLPLSGAGSSLETASAQGHLDQCKTLEILRPSSIPMLFGGNRIVRIEKIGFHPIVDFEVYGTHCYEAAGAIHHNSGKTYCISMACSYHLTGEYPSWWKGRRFDKPIRMWVASRKTEFLRDVAQRALSGPPEDIGTGSIPLGKIIKVTKRAGSIPDALDTITVRHKSGGVSRVKFKSYEEGWETFQGESVDVVWLDEEPDDFKVYTEALARIGDRRGLLMISFTPLKGRTETIVRFMEQRVSGSAFIVIGLKDTTHLTQEQIEEMVAGYPKHERDARVDGEPKLGAGAVFGDIDPDLVEAVQIDVADHWYRIVGQDYGLDHPTVLAFIAHDREMDNWYLYDLHCASEMLPDAHYMVWKKKCEAQNVQIPVAWPADGRQRGKGSGVALQQQYRDLGMLMLDESAKLPEFDVEGKAYSSRTSVEAQILLMHTAMRQGRFKVLKHLEPFWREFRRYHRKEDGKLTDKGDDVLAALRYGCVMEMQGHGVQKTAPAIYLPRKTYSSRYG